MEYLNVLFVVSGFLCFIPIFSSADLHRFLISVSADNEPISGYYSLDLGTDTITNIALSDSWKTGEGNVQMTAGGIGLGKISLQYNLLGNSILDHDVQVLSSQVLSTEGKSHFNRASVEENSVLENDAQNVNNQDPGKETSSSTNLRETNVEEVLWLGVQVSNTWDLQNGSRIVLSEFKFDKVISQCSGHSLWTNGSGHTAVTGGIGDNNLALVSTVPEDESGSSVYSCEFSSPSKGRLRRNKRQIHREVTSKAVYSIQQIYGSIYENGFTSWQFNQEIMSFEGGAEWKNGTGTFEVVAGGVGHDLLEFKSNVQANAYGIYSYTVKFRV